MPNNGISVLAFFFFDFLSFLSFFFLEICSQRSIRGHWGASISQPSIMPKIIFLMRWPKVSATELSCFLSSTGWVEHYILSHSIAIYLDVLRRVSASYFWFPGRFCCFCLLIHLNPTFTHTHPRGFFLSFLAFFFFFFSEPHSWQDINSIFIRLSAHTGCVCNVL